MPRFERMQPSFKAAAIYTRISKDDTGRQTSTGRQERLCRKWVAERGWTLGEVFEDVDRSAWNPRVQRERFEAMLDQVVAHRVDVVVVWRLDRLVRSPAEFERFWSACRTAGVQIHSVTEPVGGDDPVSLAIVRMLVTFAGLESDVKGIRIRARTKERAERGEPQHGGIRCFGYTKGYTEIVESEAAELREAARRVLAGESTTVLAREWRERQVPTIRKGTWQGSPLRTLLMHPRYVGDRVYGGEVVATDCWEPIFDRVLAAELRACLAGGAGQGQRRPNAPGLVRGIVRCGVCGANMPVSGNRQRTRMTYMCRIQNGCGHVGVSVARLDEWILNQVLYRLESRRTGNHRTRWDHTDTGMIVGALDRRTDSLRELNRRYFVTADVTYTEWVRARDDLTLATSQQLARDAPFRRPPGLPPGVALWEVRSIWGELGHAARRAIIATELAYITVHPAPVPNVFCPERLSPAWVLPDPRTTRRPPKPRGRTVNWRTDKDGQRWPSARIAGRQVLRQRGGPYTTAEASRITGMCERTLHNHRRAGRVAVSQVGPNLGYSLAALDDLSAGRALGKPDLDAGQAAAYLSISPRNLDARVAAGDLEFRVDQRRHISYLSTDLDRFIRTSRIRPSDR